MTAQAPNDPPAPPLRVGITGQSGFIGAHLFSALRLTPELEVVEFRRAWWDDPTALAAFAARCDVIVHLAGLSRHPDGNFLKQTNVGLGVRLLDAAERAGNRPRLLLGSTTHEARDSNYHESKRELRRRFEAADRAGVIHAATLLMPNTFGPYARPFFNSVVATFCHQVARGEPATVANDAELELIYVGDLCAEIIRELRNPSGAPVFVPGGATAITVAELLGKLLAMRRQIDAGTPVRLCGDFEAKLYVTLLSYVSP